MADDWLLLKGLQWAWDHLDEIRDRLGKIRSWFRSDPGRGILIIGAGGVGKTTLSRILSGDFDWLLDEPWRYKESYSVEEYSLSDDPKTFIVVPPGQSTRREATWAEVERELALGRYRGVIVVNANGYHTLVRQSFKDHALYTGNKESFLTEYFRVCRNEELAVANRIAVPIRSSPSKIWWLSIIVKEDLWWPNRQQVLTFYESGSYAAALAPLVEAKGLQSFRHELISVSLVIGNLLSGEDEPLRKNVEGYDHKQQIESVRRLFELLTALKEWERSE